MNNQLKAINTSLIRNALKAIDVLDTQIEELKAAAREPVAIIGMSCRFPGGAHTPQAFWDMLIQKKDAVTDAPDERWDKKALYDADSNAAGKLYSSRGGFIDGVDRFDAAFFNISPLEAIMMDPQQRLSLETSWHALEDAGIAPDSLSRTKTGVFVGIGQQDYAFLTMQQAGEQNINAYYGLGNGHCFTPGRISHLLGLQGPSFAIDTACSSSLVAVHTACQSLRNNECDIALAGGVQLMLSPLVSIYLSRTRALSASGHCRSFSADADGFVRAEGVGMIVLKKLRDAVRDGDRILSVIKGSAVNHDGSSSGITVPNGLAQQQLLRDALEAAGEQPSSLSYVEAHGTGTVLGDPIELDALDTVYAGSRQPEQPLWVGSVKSNIGHLEAASGIAGLIKTSLMLQHRTIPANLHFTAPNPQFGWGASPLRVPVENIPVQPADKPLTAAVSAFGLSGTNVHMILSEGDITEAGTRAPLAQQIITLSAKDEKALYQKIKDLQVFLENNRDALLEDIAFTANTGRQHFKQRIAWVVKDRAALLQVLSKFRSAEDIQVYNSQQLQHYTDLVQVITFLHEETPLIKWVESAGEASLEGYLQLLAAVYIRDEEPVNWKALYKDCHYRKTALPLMPFDKQRYWIDMLPGGTANSEKAAARPVVAAVATAVTPAPVAASDNIEDHAYDYAWLQQELPLRAAGTVAPDWLLFIERPEEKARWQSLLQDQQSLRFVLFGEEWEAGEDTFTIDPLNDGHWDRLQSQAGETFKHPFNIVYASTLAVYATLHPELSAPDIALSSTIAMLKLAQHFSQPGGAKPSALYIITRDAVAVNNTEPMSGWQQSGIIGFCKSLSLEMPAMLKGVMDITTSLPDADWQEAVKTFLFSSAEPLAAYRGNGWYMPRLQPLAPGAVNGKAGVDIDPEGVYIVTGGTGYLGLKAIKWLAAKGAGKIFVTSRSGRWSGDQSPFDGNGKAPEIVMVKADISRAADVDFLFEEVKRVAGNARIAGMVHAAGTAGFQDVHHVTPELLTSIVTSKVHGTWWLYEKLAKKPLDFVIGFSSISSAWGSHGQTHYSTANQFLDALLQYWNSKGQRAISVHWGPWGGGGMAGTEDIEMLGKRGINAFPADQSMDILGTLLKHNSTQPVVVNGNWSVFCPLFAMLGKGNLFELLYSAAPAAGTPAERNEPASELRMQIESLPSIQAEQVLVQFLKEQVGEILAYQNGQLPDSRQGLFEMGMDSMSVIQLKERIEMQLQLSIQVTDIFEYRTIEQLCGHLLEKIREEAASQEETEETQPSFTHQNGTGNDQPLTLQGSLPVDELLEKLTSHIKILEDYAN